MIVVVVVQGPLAPATLVLEPKWQVNVAWLCGGYREGSRR